VVTVVRVSPRLIRELRARLQQGARQYEIASKVGLHPTTVSQLINGAIPIRQRDDRVIRLGAALGVPAAECFIDGRGWPSGRRKHQAKARLKRSEGHEPERAA